MSSARALCELYTSSLRELISKHCILSCRTGVPKFDGPTPRHHSPYGIPSVNKIVTFRSVVAPIRFAFNAASDICRIVGYLDARNTREDESYPARSFASNSVPVKCQFCSNGYRICSRNDFNKRKKEKQTSVHGSRYLALTVLTWRNFTLFDSNFGGFCSH